MELTPKGKIIKGYKATDKDMCCRGFKFKLGKWYEHDGELSLCESGFHFCEYPSGPFAYYQLEDTRIFECEAEFVLLSSGPGADLKHVAKKIRLTKEINISGYMNTGYGNTGNGNTGYGNTGNGNTGNRNAGYGNTGYGNTGNMNTGYMNTGYGNTGNGNTGDRNTGDGNTGDRNTGNRNTGDGNIGDGNVGNYHSGYFNIGEADFIVFGKKADRKNFNFSLANELCKSLSKDEDFDANDFLSLPNATVKKIKALHREHIRLRKEKKEGKC